MTLDPTQMFYDTEQPLLQSPELEIILAACRFLKLTNPNKMFGWSEEDSKDVLDALAGINIQALQEAFEELKLQSRINSCDFGDFHKLAHAARLRKQAEEPAFRAESDPNDWREKEIQFRMQHEERQLYAPRGDSKAIKVYWMGFIKADLAKGGGLTRPLPYDKNERIR